MDPRTQHERNRTTQPYTPTEVARRTEPFAVGSIGYRDCVKIQLLILPKLQLGVKPLRSETVNRFNGLS